MSIASGELSDIAVRRTVGAHAYSAGRTYARQGRVGHLTVGPARATVSGTVQGTRPTPYRVVATRSPGGQGWAGHCSCPVAADCKHVAAVLLAAQRLPEQSAARTAWEAPIAALLRDRTAAPERSGTPLALQLELVEQPRVVARSGARPAAGGSAARQRIRIRPVTRGRTGNWVRTGVSWRDFQIDVGWTTYRRGQHAVLRSVLAAQRAHSPGGYSGYSYGYAAQDIHLDELGPSLWRLLDQARAAEVELVWGKSGGSVAVADPVAAALDLRHDGRSTASLRPVIVAAEQTVDLTDVQLIGAPPHGVFVTDRSAIAALAGPVLPGQLSPVLLLAALDPAPDEHVAGLLAAGQQLEIPDAELPRFLASYYPALRQAVHVVSSDHTVELPEIHPPQLALTATFEPGHEIALDWRFAYRDKHGCQWVPLADGAAEPSVGADAAREVGLRDGSLCRDATAERRLLDELAPAGRALLAPGLRLTGMEAVSFTRDLLPDLAETPDVELTLVGDVPDFRPAELPPVIRLSTTDVDDDPDWFDLGVTVSVDGEEVPFQRLFVALAGEQSHLVLDSGVYVSLESPELGTLRRLIEEARGLQDRQSDRLTLSVYQAGLWEELLQLGVVQQQSQRWAAAVQGLLDIDRLEPPSEPESLQAQLRPYQREGFSWLSFLWQHRLGGILADDMGLGKTIQTLAMICHVREQDDAPGPFLVVAPTSVVGTWADEASRFTPGLKVRAVTETAARRGTPLAEDVAGADLVITSYALFRIDIESYTGLDWSGLILDEAQFVKNHQAKTYQCARRLAAPFKLAVTGTPLENSLMDLWSLLSIVAPGLYPSPQRFAEVYRRPIERGADPELLATLRRRVRPLLLRRTKEQVIAELPPKQEQVLQVTLNPKHQKVYQTHLQRERRKVLGLLDDLDRNRFEIFRSLTLLRQLSLAPVLVDPAYAQVPSSKIDVFIEKLSEAVEGGHRALVFSQFTGFLHLVRDRLAAEGIDHCYLDGSTRRRASRIAEFKTGDAPVFLISLKAGGVGLNLTEADYCFVLDPWWNPAVEAQAVDRTHRIGQDKTVMVYRLVAAGTIEEKVMELKARKQSLFSRVMDDDALLSAPLSVDDIRGLFG